MALLMQNVHNLEKPQEIIFYTRFLISLIRTDTIDTKLILEGYLDLHNQKCNKDECPLKQRKLMKMNRIVSGGKALSTIHMTFIQILFKYYIWAINKSTFLFLSANLEKVSKKWRPQSRVCPFPYWIHE